MRFTLILKIILETSTYRGMTFKFISIRYTFKECLEWLRYKLFHYSRIVPLLLTETKKDYFLKQQVLICINPVSKVMPALHAMAEVGGVAWREIEAITIRAVLERHNSSNCVRSKISFV